MVSRTFKRIIAGVFVLALVTIAWVGATQCLKVNIMIIVAVFDWLDRQVGKLVYYDTVYISFKE